ncbi:hypothetical protein NNRS527_01421 [Nitrosospira sp. NRS527]|nr:hypothetical protein NNRS527_01421 [Nitrosospira sp. NRS527]
MRQIWARLAGGNHAGELLSRMSKDRILEVVGEVVYPQVAQTLTKIKKGELVELANAKLSGLHWLPRVISMCRHHRNNLKTCRYRLLSGSVAARGKRTYMRKFRITELTCTPKSRLGFYMPMLK